MKKYIEYWDLVEGYQEFKNLPVPQSVSKFYAYLDGQATLCNSEAEAYKISKLTERIVINKEEIDDYWKKARYFESEAHRLWYDDLRNEYNDVSDGVFELCYNRVILTHDSYGHDTVADELYDIIYFVKNIIDEVK